MERPASASWGITETPDGWKLEMRYRVPLADLLPGYVRRNLPYAFSTLAINLGLLGMIGWAYGGSTWLGLLRVIPAVLALGVGMTVVFWPFRFGDWGPPSQDYFLRYNEANRIETVTCARGHVDLWAGMYDLAALRTLRLQHADHFGNLVNLVFDGAVVRDVQLTKWPGLPEDVARMLCDALLVRAGHDGRESLTSASSGLRKALG